MKTFFPFRRLISLSMVWLSTGCEKDQGPVTVTPIPVSDNPTVSAGFDQVVILPLNTCLLLGAASFRSVIPTVSWTKISGPSSFSLEKPNNFLTSLGNLEKGVYEFEIAAFGFGNYSDKDTCRVTVNELPAVTTDIVLNNQVWQDEGLSWGSGMIIPNIYQYIPAGRVFKVFLERSPNQWEELPYGRRDARYLVGIIDGSLTISSMYVERGTAGVKLVY